MDMNHESLKNKKLFHLDCLHFTKLFMNFSVTIDIWVMMKIQPRGWFNLSFEHLVVRLRGPPGGCLPLDFSATGKHLRVAKIRMQF